MENETEMKQVAYYRELVRAWIMNRMEFDRWLLALNVIGIVGLSLLNNGLISTSATGLSDVRVWISDPVLAYPWFIGVLAFTCSIIGCMRCWRLNATYLTQLIHGFNADNESKALSRLTRNNAIGCVIGMVSLLWVMVCGGM